MPEKRLSGIVLAALVLSLIVCDGPYVRAQNHDENLGKTGLIASFNTESAPVGGMVDLEIRYTLPEGAYLTEGPEIKGIEDLTVVAKEAGDGAVRLKILLDKLGGISTGPIELGYIDKNNEKSYLGTDGISLSTLSNLGERPEEAQLRPIQGIIYSWPYYMVYLFWIGIVLLVVLAGLLAFWLYKKRKRIMNIIRPQDPPHIIAGRELQYLNSQGLFEKGKYKEFYFRFSAIIRTYMETLRGFPAGELTTEEIVRHVSDEKDRRIVDLLRQADLVKFADSVPAEHRKETDMDTVLGYIQETAPTDSSGRGVK